MTMGAALRIRGDLSASELRGHARRAKSVRAASRALAIANALDGMSRAQAARLAGMERQALRDAVWRYNAEGLVGLEDRLHSGPPPGLSDGEEATLRALLLRGPNPERDGISAYTREDIAHLIEQRFGKRYHPASLSKVLRRMAFSRQKARPAHPNRDLKAQAAWIKKGSRAL
jgi:transposase